MKIKEGFVLRTVGGEQVVVGESVELINFNKLISLNNSAAYIWSEVVDREFTLDEAIAIMKKKYDVSEEVLRADLTELFNEWATVGLLDS